MSEAADADLEFPSAEGPIPSSERPNHVSWVSLVPGLITGASDDDPSGVATYSQAGAQVGFALLWLMPPFTYPLMAVTQEISARLGRTTGRGLAGNIRHHYPPWVAQGCIGLLLLANVINLGADLGSIGAVSQMLAGGLRWPYVVAFGLICIGMQVVLEYTRYAKVLKWLTLSLLAYFGTTFMVAVPWREALHGLLVPSWQNSKDYISLVVAVLGYRPKKLIGSWRLWLLERCRGGDFTLRGLVAELAERGLKADYRVVREFVHAEQLSHKKDADRQRTGPPRCRAPACAVAALSPSDRSVAPGVHRRDLDQD
jgi:Natural resistance-associated macrophage protein